MRQGGFIAFWGVPNKQTGSRVHARDDDFMKKEGILNGRPAGFQDLPMVVLFVAVGLNGKLPKM